MRRNLRRLAIWGSLALAFGNGGDVSVLAQTAPPAATGSLPMAEPATQAERELQVLTQQLSQVGEALLRDVQSPHAWKYQVQQADLLLQIAFRSKGEERDRFLKMSIDTYHSAAIQSDSKEPLPMERITQLPTLVRRYFPDSDSYSYAALQGLRAAHARQLQDAPTQKAKAQEDLVQRLLAFAQQYPQSREAIPAIQEAAQTAESLSKSELACQCYRLLSDKYPGTPAARKARLALRQLGGLDGEVVSLKLPLLYPAPGEQSLAFDLRELQGKLVVLYFWSSENPNSAEGFETIKSVLDRYRSRGVEAVFVCMDSEPGKAREFLAGRLISGTHVVLKEGLNSPIAERYGLEHLPEVFLLSKTGTMLSPGLNPSQVGEALSAQLGSDPRRR